MNKNEERELCLFVKIPIFTVGRLNNYPYQLMVQGDLNTSTEAGIRVTNRVRMTANQDGSEAVYSTATKFRFPRQEGSVDTRAPQVEFNIDKADFDTIMGMCTSRYVKRRYTVQLKDGLLVEFDRYMTDADTNEFSPYIKIDIENGKQEEIDLYLAELKELGFHISEIINPPGVDSPEIGEMITKLMSEEFNLAHTG